MCNIVLYVHIFAKFCVYICVGVALTHISHSRKDTHLVFVE